MGRTPTAAMNDEILSITSTSQFDFPREYRDVLEEKTEREIAYSLFKKIDDGNYYSVKITKTKQIRDVEVKRVDARAHRIPVMNIVYKPQPYLTFFERLKVLFTGHYPVRIEWE